jgi:MerR family transcriptional regulator, thiopeptide resistance regulator
MAKARKNPGFGAAECARRTGLTPRALRIYERNGLIAPKRSAKGWRLYGPRELLRLNTIMALKGLGMTLGQIREILAGKSPPLMRVLRVQLETWRSRKAATEKVIGLIEVGLSKLRDRHPLSVDDLCALLRMSDAKDTLATAREVIQETLTTAEQREWHARMLKLPTQELAENRKLFQQSQLIAREFRNLMEQGADPACVEAQKLLKRHNTLLLDYHAREKYLARAEWNPALAQKIFAAANRTLERTTATTPFGADGQLIEYILTVRNASRWWPLMEEMLTLAKGLNTRKALPDSAVAEELAKRFTRLCRASGLGNALVYARWQSEFGLCEQGGKWVRYDTAARNGWKYIGVAVHQLSEKPE